MFVSSPLPFPGKTTVFWIPSVMWGRDHPEARIVPFPVYPHCIPYLPVCLLVAILMVRLTDCTFAVLIVKQHKNTDISKTVFQKSWQSVSSKHYCARFPKTTVKGLQLGAVREISSYITLITVCCNNWSPLLLVVITLSWCPLHKLYHRCMHIGKGTEYTRSCVIQNFSVPLGVLEIMLPGIRETTM